MNPYRLVSCIPTVSALPLALQAGDPLVAALALLSLPLCRAGVEASGLAAFASGALAAAQGASLALLPLTLAPLTIALASPVSRADPQSLAYTLAPPAYAVLLTTALSHGARINPLAVPGFTPQRIEAAVLVFSGLVGAGLLYMLESPRREPPGTLLLAEKVLRNPLLPLEVFIVASTLAPAFYNPGFLLPIAVGLAVMLAVRLLFDKRLALPAYILTLYIILQAMGLVEDYQAFLPA